MTRAPCNAQQQTDLSGLNQKLALPMKLLPLALALALAASALAQDRPRILALMHRANDYQLKNPIMKPQDRNWERGTWYTGVMAAYHATGDARFLEQAIAWGKLHNWQVGTEKCGANRLFCVQTWLEIYFAQKEKNRALFEPAVLWLATDRPNSPAGAKLWYLEGDHSYCDSLYGAAALAMLTQATGDKKYLDIMHTYFWDITHELLDKEANLFYRDKRFIAKQSPNGRKILWSRGNGWVIGGIVRVLQYLPKDEPRYKDYLALYKTLAASIAKCQQPDGFWRANLADPDHAPNPESSGTGFFCYALAWGINNNILDRAAYEPVVNKAWSALQTAIDDEGRIRYGQLVGDQPKAADARHTHEYVTGTFLLAASEIYKLKK